MLLDAIKWFVTKNFNDYTGISIKILYLKKTHKKNPHTFINIYVPGLFNKYVDKCNISLNNLRTHMKLGNYLK